MENKYSNSEIFLFGVIALLCITVGVICYQDYQRTEQHIQDFNAAHEEYRNLLQQRIQEWEQLKKEAEELQALDPQIEDVGERIEALGEELEEIKEPKTVEEAEELGVEEFTDESGVTWNKQSAREIIPNRVFSEMSDVYGIDTTGSETPDIWVSAKFKELANKLSPLKTINVMRSGEYYDEWKARRINHEN